MICRCALLATGKGLSIGPCKFCTAGDNRELSSFPQKDVKQFDAVCFGDRRPAVLSQDTATFLSGGHASQVTVGKPKSPGRVGLSRNEPSAEYMKQLDPWSAEKFMQVLLLWYAC